MSRRLAEQVFDDLTGAALDPDDLITVDLTYRDKRYLIDLSLAHAEELDQILQPYLRSAKEIGLLTDRLDPAGSTLERRQHNAALRRWAAANGHHIPSRGRLPEWIKKAYEQR